MGYQQEINSLYKNFSLKEDIRRCCGNINFLVIITAQESLKCHTKAVMHKYQIKISLAVRHFFSLVNLLASNSEEKRQ